MLFKLNLNNALLCCFPRQYIFILFYLSFLPKSEKWTYRLGWSLKSSRRRDMFMMVVSTCRAMELSFMSMPSEESLLFMEVSKRKARLLT